MTLPEPNGIIIGPVVFDDEDRSGECSELPPENQTDEWRPIAQAKRCPGIEIIGTQWVGGKCTREPFISFWSPTLNKFYCDPTHWIPAPGAPRGQR